MSQGLETGLSDSTQMEEIRKIVDPQLLKYVESMWIFIQNVLI